MCIVCQNAPTMMTALAGGGLVIRTAIRRARGTRAVAQVGSQRGDERTMTITAVPARTLMRP
jgi:hypothetical protein